MTRRHHTIAKMALQRGFLDVSTYGRVIDAIEGGDAVEDAPVERFWLEGGWLQKEQLDAILVPRPTPLVEPPPVMGAARGRFERAATVPPPLPVAPLEPVSVEAVPPSAEIVVPTPPAAPSRYRTRGLIGCGGMGDVYEAVDVRLERPVALKVARPGAEASVAQILAREARVASALEHPAIVPVYDAGDEPGIGPYYAMRLLDQPTLEDVIRRLADGQPAALRDYTLGRLLRYYVQICQAVDYAHSRGVVHCDLKPANIVVGQFGDVVILDWGMAFKLDEQQRNRGGTPGYMAPEQVIPNAAIDARADIFALGAVLYEILCHEAAYGEGITELIMHCAEGTAEMPPPPPPRTLRPSVPEGLEAICLRAMQIDPAARYASARELASDIEAFLEGTQERERRELRAAELVEQGDQLAEMYREYVDSRPRLVEEVARTRDGLAAWEGAERKRALWDAEDRLSATDAVGVRTFQAAVAAYEQALDEQPGHEAARRGLAQLYAVEVRRARERRDQLNRIYFEELVKQYSDGSPALLSRSEGLLRIAVGNGELALTLHEYEEQDRRLQPVRSRPIAAGENRVAAGSYLLEVRWARGAATVPVMANGDEETDLELDAAVYASLGRDERYVPAGVALLGGDDLSPWGREVRPVRVAAFVIAEVPVTFADYLLFVEELAHRGEDPTPYLPANALGVPHWRWDQERFHLAGNFGLAADELMSLPAVGVSFVAAEAYAAWRLLKTGRTYRLPREDEWEKAARGVDGRPYPWGDYFDASFCKMYQSRPGAPRPEQAGIFAADVSPYGVRDLAGGVAEWVVAADGATEREVARGGAWCDWRADCHLATRRPYHPGARTSRVGFRLARDP